MSSTSVATKQITVISLERIHIPQDELAHILENMERDPNTLFTEFQNMALAINRWAQKNGLRGGIWSGEMGKDPVQGIVLGVDVFREHQIKVLAD